MERQLRFDGSHLGAFPFGGTVLWCRPVREPKEGRIPVLMALLCLDGHRYPVFLKRNFFGTIDQCLLDELKPLFGLNKIGTHRIRLQGIPHKIVEAPWLLPNGLANCQILSGWSEYLIFRCEAEYDDENRPIFVNYPVLTSTYWMPYAPETSTPVHTKFTAEIQRILVFRDLFRVSDTTLDNILVRYNPHRETSVPTPLSIDEMSIRRLDQKYKWLTTTNENFFFPKSTSKGEVLTGMFGMTRENYHDIIRELRQSLHKAVFRLSPDHIWLVDYVTDRIINQVELYFKMDEDRPKDRILLLE